MVKLESKAEMNIDKTQVLENICYTQLVYGRINKKLKSNFSNAEIEKLIFETIEETEIYNFEKREELLHFKFE